MGGRRLAPGQAVDALDEAIDLIRSLWNTSGSRQLHFKGEHYRLDGAQPGPMPAHDIPIWLGAYKPRMLRLIGQKADGWLPSLGYMKPGEFQSGNTIIDAAAREAGRDPREIRRLVNIAGRFSAARGGFLDGPSAQWVEQLLPLVVDAGVGTFILMADDPQIMEQFALEVAPALREAVSRALPDASASLKTRRAAVRAKRRAGIDYDNVPASLADTVIEPGDSGFARVKSTYMRGGSPGLVFQVFQRREQGCITHDGPLSWHSPAFTRVLALPKAGMPSGEKRRKSRFRELHHVLRPRAAGVPEPGAW